MSMKSVWQEGGEKKAVTSPISLVISAFATTPDATQHLTPQLRTDAGESDLILLDLGRARSVSAHRASQASNRVAALPDRRRVAPRLFSTPYGLITAASARLP